MLKTSHIVTVDTREQVFDGTRYRPIPGTGESLPCHCCGRQHEVHALMAVDEYLGVPGARTIARIGTLNYGVSCAKKLAPVPSGTITRFRYASGKPDATYERHIAAVRAAVRV